MEYILMFKAGEKVIYGTHGLCTVTGMEKSAGRQFYVLIPEYEAGTRFLIPTDSEPALRKLYPLATASEWNRIFAAEETRSYAWEPDERRRKQNYKELIANGSREKLVAVLFAIYSHQQRQKSLGRKLHQADETFLRDTERMLMPELCYVFNLDEKTAKGFLRTKYMEVMSL